MIKRTVAGIIASLTVASSAFAVSAPVPALISADPAVSKIAYYGNSNVTYEFDKAKLADVYSKGTKFLYEVKCDRQKFLNSLGMASMPKAVKSFTFENEGMNVYADTETCAMNGSSANAYAQTQGTITESEALTAVSEFEKTVLKKLRLPLGERFVSNKFDNRIMYAKDAAGTVAAESPEFDVVTDDDSDTEIGKEYYSIEITYPILVSGKKISDQYGNVQGVTVTVNGDGKVSWFNVPFSNVKLVKRTAKTITSETLSDIVSKGGNSPYYSQTGTGETVKFDKIERAIISFNAYSDGKSKLYVSSGTRLVSDKNKPYSEGKYETSVSDYEIGNVNVRY